MVVSKTLMVVDGLLEKSISLVAKTAFSKSFFMPMIQSESSESIKVAAHPPKGSLYLPVRGVTSSCIHAFAAYPFQLCSKLSLTAARRLRRRSRAALSSTGFLAWIWGSFISGRFSGSGEKVTGSIGYLSGRFVHDFFALTGGACWES